MYAKDVHLPLTPPGSLTGEAGLCGPPLLLAEPATQLEAPPSSQLTTAARTCCPPQLEQPSSGCLPHPAASVGRLAANRKALLLEIALETYDSISIITQSDDTQVRNANEAAYAALLAPDMISAI